MKKLESEKNMKIKTFEDTLIAIRKSFLTTEEFCKRWNKEAKKMGISIKDFKK